MVEMLKTLGMGAWGIIAALVGLSLFVTVAIPLGHWFWAWMVSENHAIGLIAAALVVYVVNALHPSQN